MYNDNVVVVVPSVREESWNRFQKEWIHEFAECPIILIEDNAQRTFNSSTRIIHIAWDHIDRTLGDHKYIIPRRTDCVRSFGYLLAWAMGFKYTITLDDDCYPKSTNFLRQHLDSLVTSQIPAWKSTGDGVLPRGIPYFNLMRKRPVAINHGLWSNVIDFDAVTQMASQRIPISFEPIQQTIPYGMYYPMCGMNLSWRTEFTPMMYFLLMGKMYGYDRFGDIWCGIISKKICDHLGFAVTSGSPIVHHDRASNVFDNIVKEAEGYRLNEDFWEIVDSIILSGESVIGCLKQICDVLVNKGGFLETLGKAYHVWIKFFEVTEPVTSSDPDRLNEALRRLGRASTAINT